MQILSIGNSFSQDAQRYLSKIARANGELIQSFNLFIGGCPLSTHYRCMLNEKANYMLEMNGVGTGFYVSLKEALLTRNWDVITIQQVSSLSPKYESYQPYLNAVIEYVRKMVPKAKIAVHQTWAYEIDSDHGGFLHYNRDQKEMYRRICDCTEMACRLIGATVLPSGPVVQYLRENAPEFDYKGGALSLNRDGFHLSWDYGRYAAAATWFKVLTGNVPSVNAFPEWDAHLIDVIHAGITAVLG